MYTSSNIVEERVCWTFDVNQTRPIVANNNSILIYEQQDNMALKIYWSISKLRFIIGSSCVIQFHPACWAALDDVNCWPEGVARPLLLFGYRSNSSPVGQSEAKGCRTRISKETKQITLFHHLLSLSK